MNKIESFKKYWRKRLPVLLGRPLESEDEAHIDYNSVIYDKSNLKLDDFYVDEQEIYRLKAANSVVKSFNDIEEINKSTLLDDETKLKIQNLFPKKGEDGKDGITPIKGKDYFTKDEVKLIEKSVKNEVLKVIKSGKDGKTPKKGKDYFTKADIESIEGNVIKTIQKSIDTSNRNITMNDVEKRIREILSTMKIFVDKSGFNVTSSSLSAIIKAGTNVTIVEDAVANTLTINSLGGGGDLTNYYTKAEADAKFVLITTLGNYYTKTESDGLLAGKEPIITAGTTAQYFRGDKTFQTLDTSVVPESGNLYFTDERAQDAVGNILTDTSLIDLTYNDGSNTISANIIKGTEDYVLSSNASDVTWRDRSPQYHEYLGFDPFAEDGGLGTALAGGLQVYKGDFFYDLNTNYLWVAMAKNSADSANYKQINIPFVLSVNGLGGAVVLNKTHISNPVTTIADANYSVTSGDYIVELTSQTALRTFTLPACAGLTGIEYRITKANNAAFNLNVAVTNPGSERINGTVTTYAITTAYTTIHLHCDGANWWF